MTREGQPDSPAWRLRRVVRLGMAVGGLLAMLVVLALLPPFGSAAPRWAWRFFLIWSLGVPYWHWVEYRWLNDGSADFLRQQALSRAVWAGGMAVLATYLLAGAR